MEIINPVQYITIINSQEQRYTLDRKYLCYLGTIQHMVEDLFTDDKQQNIEIYLENAEMNIIKIIGKILIIISYLISFFFYLDRFCSLCETQRTQDGKLEVGEWGLSFLLDHDEMFEKIVSMTDFLEFKILYDTCKNYFKFLVKTMNETELRKKFNLPDDLTVEDKKKNYNIRAYILK